MFPLTLESLFVSASSIIKFPQQLELYWLYSLTSTSSANIVWEKNKTGLQFSHPANRLESQPIDNPEDWNSAVLTVCLLQGLTPE